MRAPGGDEGSYLEWAWNGCEKALIRCNGGVGGGLEEKKANEGCEKGWKDESGMTVEGRKK